MKEQLVSFQVAKLAKEKGFNEVLHISDTSYFYYDDFLSTGSNTLTTYRYNERPDISLAPNQSLLAKWLRDVHNLSVEVCVGENKWEYSIYTIKGFEHMISSGIIFTVYEEALEAGLNNALQLI